MLGVLQLCAAAGGVVTTVLMLRQHDPTRGAERTPVSLGQALSPFRDRAMRGLLRYVLVWNLAVGAGGELLRPLHAAEPAHGVHAARAARHRHGDRRAC